MSEQKEKDKVVYRQIGSGRALADLRFESPKTYQKVLKLREEHACLMKLPVEKIIPLMQVAVEGLINDGICKRMAKENNE